MPLGNLSPLIYVYNGNPTGVSTSIIDVPKGSLVIDTVTPAVWQKTSALGSNAGYEQIIIGDPGITIKVSVADEEERLDLTIADVQQGDFVLQEDTGVLYEVVDETELGSEDAFAAVKNIPIGDIAGLQDALDDKSDVGHTHAIEDVTGLQDALDDKVDAEILDLENDERLALVDPAVGTLVRVTDEADRIELFLGGDPSENDNWAVITPTIELTVNATLNGCEGVEIAGVALDEGDGTYPIGWVNPWEIGYDHGDSSTDSINVSYGVISVPGSAPIDFGSGFSFGGYAPAFAAPVGAESPRAAITLNIEVNAPA